MRDYRRDNKCDNDSESDPPVISDDEVVPEPPEGPNHPDHETDSPIDSARLRNTAASTTA
jgi:hypothetical protein